MTDAYQWWRDALRGIIGPVHDGNPQPGFYRLRKGKDAPWQPVAIWTDATAGVQCVVGAEFAPTDADATWLSCARHPVSEEDYRHACKTGRWPGDHPEAPAAIGDNRPPADTDLPAQIEDAIARAKGWLHGRRIESQADADRVETFVNELSALVKKAEDTRVAEVKPHLEAQRAVQARWKPSIDATTETIRTLKVALRPYLEAREAERKAAAAQAIAQGAEPARVDTRATTSGTSGRKVSLRTVKRAVITDFDAAMAFFKDHPDMKALVQRLADKVAAVGGTVPGVEVKTERNAA